jgi:hypothetical protein
MEKCAEETRNNSSFFQSNQQKGTVEYTDVEMITVKKIRKENKVRNKECLCELLPLSEKENGHLGINIHLLFLMILIGVIYYRNTIHYFSVCGRKVIIGDKTSSIYLDKSTFSLEYQIS